MERVLEDSEVAEIEQRIDAYYSRMPLPSISYQLCTWHALTVAEDSLRLFLIGRSQRQDMNQTEILHQTLSWTNQTKYGLRHSLDRIRKEKAYNDLEFRTPRLNETEASIALDLLFSGVNYDVAYRAFSSYWAGRYQCTINTDGTILTFNSRMQDARHYEALYWLLSSERTGMSLILLYLVLCTQPL